MSTLASLKFPESTIVKDSVYACSHVHVSLRDKDGKNVFAVSGDEVTTGRKGASYDDTKFISQEAEWFLAGILDGIADGT